LDHVRMAFGSDSALLIAVLLGEGRYQSLRMDAAT
jgi:hypothetical protein